MHPQKYIQWISYFQTHPTAKTVLLAIAKLGPLIAAGSYILFIISYVFDSCDFICLYVPAACLIVTTLLRKMINQPRPFEIYGFTPLICHEKGESFPSRHSASALIIALTIFQCYPLSGILLTADALLIGLSRILMGVHFPKDVICGYILACLFSCIYFL